MKKSSPILSASLSSVKMITFTAYQCGGVAMALQGQKSNNIFHNRDDVSSNLIFSFFFKSIALYNRTVFEPFL